MALETPEIKQRTVQVCNIPGVMFIMTFTKQKQQQNVRAETGMQMSRSHKRKRLRYPVGAAGSFHALHRHTHTPNAEKGAKHFHYPSRYSRAPKVCSRARLLSTHQNWARHLIGRRFQIQMQSPFPIPFSRSLHPPKHSHRHCGRVSGSDSCPRMGCWERPLNPGQLPVSHPVQTSFDPKDTTRIRTYRVSRPTSYRRIQQGVHGLG